MDYWQSRSGFHYYQEALRLCRHHGRAAGSVLEVGPRDTTFLDWLDWIPRKVAIDQEVTPVVAAATNIRGDFLTWQAPGRFDLAVCLQVLEHLDDVVPFAGKLLASCHRLIVSVPYRWPAGACAYHRQDPVDLEDVERWFARPSIEHSIVRDTDAARLIAVFEADSADIRSA